MRKGEREKVWGTRTCAGLGKLGLNSRLQASFILRGQVMKFKKHFGLFSLARDFRKKAAFFHQFRFFDRYRSAFPFIRGAFTWLWEWRRHGRISWPIRTCLSPLENSDFHLSKVLLTFFDSRAISVWKWCPETVTSKTRSQKLKSCGRKVGNLVPFRQN